MKKTLFVLLFFAILTCSYDHIIQPVDQSRHFSYGTHYKAIVGKPYADTIQWLSNDAFLVEILSPPPHVAVNNHIISWTPAISDTGIKSFIVTAKTRKYDDYVEFFSDYVDTLKYEIMVFDSSVYSDFAPIQKGFYWLFKGSEGVSTKYEVGYDEYKTYGNINDYFLKIKIDSTWANGDSLFFNVSQQFYKRKDSCSANFFNQINGTSSLPDSNASFTAIYSNDTFFQINDLFLSKLFSFRYVKKSFNSIYNTNDTDFIYSSEPCGYFRFFDYLSIFSNSITRTTAKYFHTSLPDCHKPEQYSDSLICRYQSDVGLLEFNYSLFNNMGLLVLKPLQQPMSSFTVKKLTLIEYNFGKPVKLN
jgi:hypothetical protein